MDAPRAICNLGRLHLRAAWRHIGPSTEPPGSSGASHHQVNRRAVHRARDGQQGTDSRANANQGGPAVFGSGSRAGY